MTLGIGGLGHATEIGVGASAVVYKAMQLDLDREVAVKVLSSTDEAFVRRFRREAMTLGKLSLHPGIVTVHGTGVTDSGQPYLTLELCESSVSDHLKAEGKFDPESARTIAAEVADALSDAHEDGVIHRDIKPANLLRSSKGRYLITDFGISTVRDSTLGQTESVSFTVGYAAPETLRGDESGTPADVFALGGTLFHMLAGHVPFADRASDSNLMAVAHRVINDPTPDLRQVGVSDDLARIVEGAMAKDPRDRPTAAQFRHQLLALPAQVEAPANVSTTSTATPTPATPAPIAKVSSMITVVATETKPTVELTSEDDGAPDEPAGRPLVVATAEPLLARRVDYPPVPHDEDGPQWKMMILGLVAAGVILLAGIAFVVAQSNGDSGDAGETVSAEPDPTAEQPERPTESSNVEETTTTAEELEKSETTNPGDGDDSDDSDEARTEIPTVTGLSQAAAEATLVGLGLTVGDPTLVFSELPAGDVVGSSPAEGDLIDPTTPITLSISRGLEPPQCASLIGLTEAAATDIITTAGQPAESARAENDTDPEGQVTGCALEDTVFKLIVSDGPEICGLVVGQTLEEGTAALQAKGYLVDAIALPRLDPASGIIFECSKQDTTATVRYSSGLPTRCPAEAIGTPAQQAQSTLKGLGFTSITLTQASSDTLALGDVIDCSVSGSAVELTVSTGPATQTGTLTLSFDALIIDGPCAGDDLQPDLYGSLSFNYNGDDRSIWAFRLPGDARTPNANGQLNFAGRLEWQNVQTDGQLTASWDLKDVDKKGRPGDEDDTDDGVSTARRYISLTSQPRRWRPSSNAPENGPCVVRLDTTLAWSALDG